MSNLVPESSPATAAPATTTNRLSILGLVSVIVVAIAIVPILVIVLVSLLPDMQAILWTLIIVLPFAGLLAAIALIIGALGLIPALNRGRSPVLPILGTAISALVVLVTVGLLSGWFTG